MTRKLLVGLALLSIMGFLGPGVGRAQNASPTAVIVTPPTAEGCDDIEAYVEQLEAVEEEALAGWDESFPGIKDPEQMSDDEYLDFVVGLPPDGLRAYADIYDRFAELVAAIEPPPVAAAVHGTLIEISKLQASLARDASYIGLVTALGAYEERSNALQAMGEAQSQAALSVCPAIQLFIDFVADDDEATPEAG